jgi:hypothetical protein
MAALNIENGNIAPLDISKIIADADTELAI